MVVPRIDYQFVIDWLISWLVAIIEYYFDEEHISDAWRHIICIHTPFCVTGLLSCHWNAAIFSLNAYIPVVEYKLLVILCFNILDFSMLLVGWFCKYIWHNFVKDIPVRKVKFSICWDRVDYPLSTKRYILLVRMNPILSVYVHVCSDDFKEPESSFQCGVGDIFLKMLSFELLFLSAVGLLIFENCLAWETKISIWTPTFLALTCAKNWKQKTNKKCH